MEYLYALLGTFSAVADSPLTVSAIGLICRDLSYNQLNGTLPDLSALTALKTLYEVFLSYPYSNVPVNDPHAVRASRILSDNDLGGPFPGLKDLTNVTVVCDSLVPYSLQHEYRCDMMRSDPSFFTVSSPIMRSSSSRESIQPLS